MWIIVAATLVVLALLAGVMLERERHRRAEQRDRELVAGLTGAQEHERVEARRVAVNAALSELQAADEDWWNAQIEHDWRIYVYAGRVRALGRAASRLADALRHAVTVNLEKNGLLVDDEWRLPYELRCERTDRPLADRWQRFDRCAMALSTIGSSEQSTIVQVADAAYGELAAAAVELASKLERAAQQPRAGKEVVCSFCGTPNNDPSVTRMIAGQGVNICNQCVTLCVKTLEKPRAPTHTATGWPGVWLTARAASHPLPIIAP